MRTKRTTPCSLDEADFAFADQEIQTCESSPNAQTLPNLSSRFLVVAVLVLLAGACGDSSTDDDGAGTGPDSSGMHTLTGDISIEGAFELSHTPASQIVVQLEDISLQDVSSVLIAEAVYEGVTTLPLTYELTWIGELHPQGDYTFGARVYDEGGELIFVTDTVFPVFPGDAKVDFHIVSVHGS